MDSADTTKQDHAHWKFGAQIYHRPHYIYGVMFSLFKPNEPIARMESALEEKRASREKLAARLATAEGMLAQKRTVAEQLALRGADDDALNRAESAIRTVAERIATLTGALAKLDEEIAKSERELEDARAQRDRETVALGLEEMASAIKRAAPIFDDAALTLIDAVTKSPASMVEANRFAAHVNDLRHSIVSISHMIIAEITANAAHVRAGNAKIAFRAERGDPFTDTNKLEMAARVTIHEG